MNLHEIVLKQVAWEEFEQRTRKWKRSIGFRKDTAYCKVENPIISRDYEEIITAFLGHDYASHINVREQGDWIKYPKNTFPSDQNLRSRIIQHVASLAESDPKKKNYFELAFRDLFPNNHWKREAVIEFVEMEDGTIVGYDVRLSSAVRDLFTVQTVSDRYNVISGLWLPPDARQISVSTPPKKRNNL